MASLNKQSVRGEVDKVKAEFDQLSQAGKVTPEVQALMGTLLLVVELILSIFLEKHEYLHIFSPQIFLGS